jgi:hypothetical protein
MLCCLGLRWGPREQGRVLFIYLDRRLRGFHSLVSTVSYFLPKTRLDLQAKPSNPDFQIHHPNALHRLPHHRRWPRRRIARMLPWAPFAHRHHALRCIWACENPSRAYDALRRAGMSAGLGSQRVRRVHAPWQRQQVYGALPMVRDHGGGGVCAELCVGEWW